MVPCPTSCALFSMKSSDNMQLDLFVHSRDVMLRNDVLASLRSRDAAAGQKALAVLGAEYPQDNLLAPSAELLKALTASTERFRDHDEAAAAVHTMQNVIVPSANFVFGTGEARNWLAVIWRSLASSAARLSYNVVTPHTHAAFMSLQGHDWVAAESATATIPSWRRIPTSLAWMAEARCGRGGLQSAWCLLVELAWIDTPRFGALARRLDAPALRKLLDDFDADFEPDSEADLAWFPAWTLITEPALAPVFREAQVCNDAAPERASRLVMELLVLERQGRHVDLVAERKRLRDLNTTLFSRYMSTR
jgi:hypothetical protein